MVEGELDDEVWLGPALLRRLVQRTDKDTLLRLFRIVREHLNALEETEVRGTVEVGGCRTLSE